MPINKLWLWGGGAAVALAVGAFVLTRGGGSSGNASDYASAFYPPTVIGGAPNTVSDSGTVTSSTDSQIAQLLSGQIAQSQISADTAKAISTNQTNVALAGFTNSQNIASINADAATKQSLASQLGNIVGAFTSLTSSQKSSNTSEGSNSSGFFGIGGGSTSKQSAVSETTTAATGPKAVTGSIGFTGNTLAVDLKGAY